MEPAETGEMSMRTNSRKRKRAAAQHAKKWDEQFHETASDVEPVASSSEALELLDSLMQFVADDNDDSSIQPETEPDSSKGFLTIDGPASICGSGIITETGETQIELVDPSQWFVETDDSCIETVADQHTSSPSEEYAAEFTCASVSEITSDETSEQAIDSSPVRVTEPSHGERRKHHREDSSHLVWLEYFDPSMQSIGKEAARTENLSAGGMRVCVKAAPSELERVSVT